MRDMGAEMNAAAQLQPVLLIDLGSIYWAAWHSSANEEVSAAHDRAVAKIRALIGMHDGPVAICCDSVTNFRKTLEPSYKANRPPRDSAAWEQLRLVKRTLEADGLLLWEAESFEADDVLATACRAALKAGHEVTVCSADKDLTQLVELGVTWFSPKTGERLDREGVKAKHGVYPERMADFLAICGDTSDNVRGVKGVGPKGAVKLLAEYETLEFVMRHSLDKTLKAPPAVAAAVHESLAWLPTSMQLVKLRYDVPIRFEDIYQQREVKPLPTRETAVTTEDYSDAEHDGREPPPKSEPKNDAPEVASEPVEPAPREPQAIVRASVEPTAITSAPSWDLGLEPTSLGQAYKFAQDLHRSRLYQRFGTAEAIFAVIVRGREMGMGALTSLDNFHMVEGKPCPHAHLLIARAKGSHDMAFLEYIGGDHTYAEYEGQTKRAEAMGRPPIKLRYTIEQARAAGLNGGNWAKRPAEMLRKTCGVQLSRILSPGSSQGLYAAEEMGGEE